MKILLVIVIIAGIIFYLIAKNNKNRKEILTIMIDNDKVRFLLGEDEYLKFNVSNKNKNEILDIIKNEINKRKNELKNVISKIVFFDDNYEEFARKLEEIIR